MAGHRLVVGGELERVPGLTGRVPGVLPVGAGPGAVQGRGHVVGQRGPGRLDRRHRSHGARLPGPAGEPAWCRRFGSGHRASGLLEHLLRAGAPQRRIVPEPSHHLGGVGPAEHPAAQFGVLLGEPGDQVEPGGVEVFGCPGRRRVGAGQGPVQLVAVRQPAQPDVLVAAAQRLDRVRESDAVAPEGRADDIGEDLVELATEPVGAVPTRGLLDAAQRIEVGRGEVVVDLLDGGADQAGDRPAARLDAVEMPLGGRAEIGVEAPQPLHVRVGVSRFGQRHHRQVQQHCRRRALPQVGDLPLRPAGVRDVGAVRGDHPSPRPRSTGRRDQAGHGPPGRRRRPAPAGVRRAPVPRHR